MRAQEFLRSIYFALFLFAPCLWSCHQPSLKKDVLDCSKEDYHNYEERIGHQEFLRLSRSMLHGVLLCMCSYLHGTLHSRDRQYHQSISNIHLVLYDLRASKIGLGLRVLALVFNMFGSFTFVNPIFWYELCRLALAL